MERVKKDNTARTVRDGKPNSDGVPNTDDRPGSGYGENAGA